MKLSNINLLRIALERAITPKKESNRLNAEASSDSVIIEKSVKNKKNNNNFNYSGFYFIFIIILNI